MKNVLLIPLLSLFLLSYQDSYSLVQSSDAELQQNSKLIAQQYDTEKPPVKSVPLDPGQKTSESDLEMATGLRSSGKIWVVVGVILIILFGFIFYLFYLERRLKKLESTYTNNI